MQLHPIPIEDSGQLTKLCQRLQTAKVIAFDTEFTHKTTYWPRLCLIQIATTDEAFLIDPLAKDIELAPLLDLLVSGPVPKIVHAGIQDAEIIHAHTSNIPSPLFDTQIMARYCTPHFNVSLSGLARYLLGVSIDKQEQLSDWSLRPLSTSQCQYALMDVIYLPRMYTLLKGKIESLERIEIVEQGLKDQYQDTIFTEKPALARKKLKIKPLSTRRELVLQELAAWREQMAMDNNVPRKYIASDQILLTIAQKLPKKSLDVENIPSLPSRFRKKNNIDKILSIVEKSTTQCNTQPSLQKKGEKKLNLINEDILLLLNTLLHHTAAEQQIAPQVLMSKKQMKTFLIAPHLVETQTPEWQWQAFGKKAQKLLQGHIAITVEGDQIRLVETYGSR